jgi:hypothetical protein
MYWYRQLALVYPVLKAENFKEHYVEMKRI